MEPLDEETSEVILKRIKWRHGIRPSGELADQPSFVLRAMPDIVLVSPDQSRSFLVTESTWSDNLVNSCVLWTLHDDATIDAAAECHAIFQRRQPVNQRTLHYLHFETFAWFPINSILRPTKKFQKALDEALQQWPETPQLAWQQLCQVWQEFGYLWPQKIVLGRRCHVSKSYKASPERRDRLHLLRTARDEVYAKLTELLREGASARTGNPYETWDIIKRNDVRPIYEFLPESRRTIIKVIMRTFVHRIPVHHPIKLRNIGTSGYLTWRFAGKGKPKQQQHQQQRSTPFFLATTFGDTTSQLWRLEWKASPPQPARPGEAGIGRGALKLDVSYEPGYVRCGSQVYLFPACETITDNKHRPPFPTQDMIMTRSPLLLYSANPEQQQGRLRSIELVHPERSRGDPDHQWTIELPGLGLARDDDESTDEHLNADIMIGRKKPILHGDIVTLRQVHYLCSMGNSPSSAVTRFTSPLPPAASASMLNLAHGSPSSSTSPGASSLFSSPLQCSTGNTSGSNNSSASKKLNSSQTNLQLSSLNVVVAKEMALIGHVWEKSWIIEIASPNEDPHYRPCPHLPPLDTATTMTMTNKPALSTLDAKANANNNNNHMVTMKTETRPLRTMMSAESLSYDRSDSSSTLRKIRSLTQISDQYKHLQPYDERFENLSQEDVEPVMEQNNATTTAAAAKQDDMVPTSSFAAAMANMPPADTDDLDVCASSRAEPYLRLYASKQNTKTWSHFVKTATLFNFSKKFSRSSRTTTPSSPS